MKLKIKVNGRDVEVEKGLTLLELSRRFEGSYKYEIILAKVDGVYKELTSTVHRACEIEFFDLTDSYANCVFLNSLIYLTLYSFKRTFGEKANIIVRHSLDKGVYIETSINITKSDITKLEKTMKQVVEEKLSIKRITTPRLDAIEYFNHTNYKTKAEIMNYNSASFVTLYKLDEMFDYFYTMMVPNTEFLSHFELTYLNETGFVLRFPTVYMNDGIKPFEERKNILNLYNSSREWAKRLDLVSVVDLNHKVQDGSIQDIIRMDELMKNHQLMVLAQNIIDNPKAKVVLLAGPSSTGKTTTTNKLKLCLKSLGKNPLMLSMDDFFVERGETPIDEEGNPDFERLEAVDLNLFEECIEKLLNKEEVKLPTFNFILGKKEYDKTTKIEDDTIILIEGIHALNPKVLENIPKNKKVKIYLSALNELGIDDHSRISTTNNRLLRRIVRDNRTRGNSVERTLELWHKVRVGEEKYIFPYQDEADYTLNTAMIYELGVLKTYVEPLLYSVSPDSPYYNEAIILINFLRLFLPIPADIIPDDSIIREFIGGGCFRV